jgi:hypothetical protein
MACTNRLLFERSIKHGIRPDVIIVILPCKGYDET